MYGGWRWVGDSDLPDHEFVVTTALVMVGVCSREDVLMKSVYVSQAFRTWKSRTIGDISTNISVRVVPLDAGGHALNLAHVEPASKLLAYVGVALDIVLPALPGPASTPRYARARGRLHGCALRAGAGGAFPPVVVVELVAVGGVVTVLRAERCCLAAHWCHGVLSGSCDWAGGGEGQEAG
jgi:hypothetical protein